MLTPTIIRHWPAAKRAEYIYAPVRDPRDPSYLKQHMNKIRTPQYREEHESKRMIRHRFHLLPAHQREEALEYFNSLCLRHADRLKIKPRFANILHMITLNRFKNPEQNSIAGKITRYKKISKWRRNTMLKHNLIFISGKGFSRVPDREERPGPRSAYLPT